MKNFNILTCMTLILSIGNSSLAQSPGDYRSKQTGTWATAATWETYTGSAWVNAATAPSSANGVISIQPGHSIISSASVTINQLAINTGGTLNISAGIFTVADTAGTDLDCSGTFTLSGGTLNGPGAVTFNSGSTFNWSGGTNGGSGSITIKAGAGFNMNGSLVYLADTKTIDNYGTWNWTGGNFHFYNGAPVINNYGTFNISTDSEVYPYNATTGSFNNKSTGIINKIGSPDNETLITGLSAFINNGTINVNSSRLRFKLNVIDSGTVNIASGANVSFTGGTAAFNTGTVLKGSGSMTFDGATAALNAGSVLINTIDVSAGTLSVTPAVTMNSGCAFNLYGGTLNGPGAITFNSGSTFNWAGGTNGGSGSITIRAGASFNMNGNTVTVADTKTISNFGTWTWTGGNLIYYNGAPVITNHGVFNISTDADVIPYNSNTGLFINSSGGVINKIGSPDNETSFNGISTFINRGSVNVNSSRITFKVNVIDSATMNVAIGAGMNFTAGSTVFDTGAALKGAGSMTFDGATATINAASVTINTIIVSAGTLSVKPAIAMNSGGAINLYGGTLNGPGAITCNSGSTFTWAGGTNGGNGSMTIKAGANFNMNGDRVYLADTKTINNYGNWTWTGGHFHFFNGSPVVNNYGTFNINTDSEVFPYNTTTGSFNNKPTGIINKIGSPENETSFNGISAFNNEGTINVNSSNLKLNVGGVHTGSYKIALGAQLSGSVIMPFTGSLFTNNGTVTLTGLSFSGSAMQSLKGNGNINAFTVNNASGVMLGGIQTINNTLTLTNGRLSLGDYTLTMGASATIAGAGPATYILTNGTGNLQRRVLNNNTNVLFPVGHAGSYMPVNIQLTPASTSDDFKVRVLPRIYEAYYANNPTGAAVPANSVNGTWMMGEGTAGASFATITFQWNATDEAPGFNRTASRFGQYQSQSWKFDSAKAATGTGPYTLSRSGLTSVSIFGITNQFVTCIKNYAAVCAGSAITVPYLVAGSFNAGNVFTAQLSDSAGSFNAPVAIGSIPATSSGNISATIPASALAGTSYRIRIASSSPSYISNDNASNIAITACAAPSRIVSSPGVTAADSLKLLQAGKLSIYPNPNNGRFVLKLNFKEAKNTNAHIQIMNSGGQIIHTEKIPVSGYELTKTISFNPSGQAGIYIISVTVGKVTHSGKIDFRKRQ